jgi:hypothetical protein
METESTTASSAGLCADEASERATNDLIHNFAAGGIIGLIGAGTSMRVGYPSWSGLLNDLRSSALRSASPDKIDELDLQQDMLVRAGGYRQLVGNAQYATLMRENFGPRSPQFTKFHEELVSLPFRHVLTTNYDPVLDTAHRKVFGFSPTIVDAKNKADLGTFVHNIGSVHGYGRRFHVHLHGRYEASSSLVLTESDYVDRYERSGTISLAMQSIVATARFLAIGFSLSDLDVLRFFRTVKALLYSSEPRHFAILGIDDIKRAAAERFRLHEKYGIEPIFYLATSDHSGLDKLVTHISQRLRNAYPRLFEPREICYVHRLPAPRAFVGRNRELETLRKKYDMARPGVIVIVGPSGSGKRSLVDEFLRTAVEPSLVPVRAFVWSFRDIMLGAYDISAGQPPFDPICEFARAAYRFCSGQPLPRFVENPFDHLWDALKNAGRIIFVLDGLDEISAGEAEPLAYEPDLLAFLKRIVAEEHQVLAIVTTTKCLDLLTGSFVEEIDVNRLSEAAAIALLSLDVGESGSDQIAERLALSVGYHAKSLTVLRALIEGPYGKDKERALRFVRDKGMQSISPSECTQLLYAEHLSHLDEAAGRLLKAVSSGLIPLSLETMAVLYAHPNSLGKDIPDGLSPERLDQLVFLLARTGMLRIYAGARRPLYAWDPAVPLRGSALVPLEAKPLDAAQQIDLVEDLAAAALPQEAVSLYTRLSRWLLTANEYRLGDRATAAFMKSGDARRLIEGLSAQQEGNILSDRGVVLHGMGELDEAIRLQELSRERDWQNSRDLAWDDFRLASIHVSRGALRKARDIFSDLCGRADLSVDYNLALLTYSRYAEASTLAGDVNEARGLLERAGQIQRGGLKRLHGAPALVYAEFLLRQGKLTEARPVIICNLKYCRGKKRDGDVLICLLHLAQIAMGAMRCDRALVNAQRVRRASEIKGWQEVLCRSFLVAGRALRVAGRDLDARSELVRGLKVAERHGFALLEADLQLELGEIMKTDAKASKDYGGKALAIAEQCGYEWAARSARDFLKRLTRKKR